MSKEKLIFIPIKRLKFEQYIDVYPLIPSLSIKVNENTFAFVCYSDERMTTYIKFISIINNELKIKGEYKLDDYIIEDSAYNIKQLKVEKDNLIILSKHYLLVEKIEIIDDNYFSFKTIFKQKFEEPLFQILCNNKIVSYASNILKIYSFSSIKAEILYEEKLNYIFFAKNKKKTEIDEMFQGVQPYDRLCHLIEIEERNEIIFSFSRLYTYGEDDIDYTSCLYYIVIMNSKNFQIKSLICDNLIEAEKLFYFGNDILYSFGLRTFYSLNLKFLKKELSLKHELVSINNHYYHYAIIPFLEKNKLFSFGYYRYGYYHNTDEFKHFCECDLTKKLLIEHKIDDLFEKKYSIEYFPIKYKNNMILFFFENELILYEVNI